MQLKQKLGNQPHYDSLNQFLIKQIKTLNFQTQNQRNLINKQYQEFFSDIDQADIGTIQEMHYKLKEHGFMIDQNYNKDQDVKNLISQDISFNFQDNFSIKVYPKTLNWDIVQLDCKLNIYRKRFLVLNQYEEKKHDLKLLAIGTMGQVYRFKYQEQNFAVKCIKKSANFKQFVKMGIKQYFIMNMMSVLQIGPKVMPLTGFDLICNQKCLQFSMEQCKPLKKIQFKLENLKQLKILLKKMHILKLIHLDIKPSNIMFSQFFQKIVFIDYGITQFINENLGQKTLTNFRGTFEYCGLQLKKSFIQRKKIYVDLYFNDVECLKNTFMKLTISNNFRNLQSNYNYKQEDLNMNMKIQLQNNIKIKLSLMKFHLIKREIQNAHKIIVSIKIKNNLEKILADIYLWLTFLPRQELYRKFGQQYAKFSKNFKQYEQFQIYYRIKKLNNVSKHDQKSKISSHAHFQTFYKSIQNCFSFSSLFSCKNKVKQILYQKNYQPIQQTYFLALVQYLSFLKNIFNTNLQQKYQISNIFLESYKKTQEKFLVKVDSFISEQIQSEKLRKIIKCVHLCLHIAQINIQNSIFRNLYIDLLEQATFLKCRVQSSQKTITIMLKIQIKIIKKIQIFIRSHYGLAKDILKINLSRQLFRLFNKRQFSSIMKSKLKQLKGQIQELFKDKVKDNTYLYDQKQKQKQFYISFLQTIQNYLQINDNQIWQCQQLQQNHGLIWKFVQKYKQKIYGQIFQSIFQIIFLLILCQNHLNKLLPMDHIECHIPKQFYQEYEFYKQKNSNIITKIDFSTIALSCQKIISQLYKLKQLLDLFDKKVNCSQISDLYFTMQRILLAYLFNQQNQIIKFSQIAFRQNYSFQTIQRTILKIGCFSSIQSPKNFFKGKDKAQALYNKIKNWMYPVIKYYLQKYANNQNQQERQQNFYKACILLHAFYSLIHNDQDFLNKQIIFLRKMKSNYQNIYLKLKKNQRRQDLFINNILKYYFDIQKDIIKQINFLINLDLKVFQKLDHFTGSYFTKNLAQIKRRIGKRLPNFKIFDSQNVIIYQMLITIANQFYLDSLQFKELIICYSLSQNQKRIMQIFYNKNSILKQKFDIQYPKIFIHNVKKLIHPKNCTCKFDLDYNRSYQFLTALLINNLKQGKIRYNFESYFAIPFGLYVIVIKQSFTIKQIRLILNFMSKAFNYLDKFTKQALLENYYEFHLNLHQQNSSKYFMILKKHFLSSKKCQYSIQQISNIYLRRTKSSHKKKTKQHIFQYAITKKIKKIKSCFLQNQIFNMKQIEQKNSIISSSKQYDRKIKQTYSQQQLYEINRKLNKIVLQLKKRFFNLSGFSHLFKDEI